jgi:hypothetical protein
VGRRGFKEVQVVGQGPDQRLLLAEQTGLLEGVALAQAVRLQLLAQLLVAHTQVLELEV